MKLGCQTIYFDKKFNFEKISLVILRFLIKKKSNWIVAYRFHFYLGFNPICENERGVIRFEIEDASLSPDEFILLGKTYLPKEIHFQLVTFPGTKFSSCCFSSLKFLPKKHCDYPLIQGAIPFGVYCERFLIERSSFHLKPTSFSSTFSSALHATQLPNFWSKRISRKF